MCENLSDLLFLFLRFITSDTTANAVFCSVMSMQHWCTLAVFPKQRVMRFYDSLLKLPDSASSADINRITNAKAAPYVSHIFKYVR